MTSARPSSNSSTSALSRSSSSLLLSSLELSDTEVYAPYIRALLGTASHFWHSRPPLVDLGVIQVPICDGSFTCEDYNTYAAHPWSPFPLRRAHPGPGPHKSPSRVAVVLKLNIYHLTPRLAGGDGRRGGVGAESRYAMRGYIYIYLYLYTFIYIYIIFIHIYI